MLGVTGTGGVKGSQIQRILNWRITNCMLTNFGMAYLWKYSAEQMVRPAWFTSKCFGACIIEDIGQANPFNLTLLSESVNAFVASEVGLCMGIVNKIYFLSMRKSGSRTGFPVRGGSGDDFLDYTRFGHRMTTGNGIISWMGCTGQCSLFPISCWQSVAKPSTYWVIGVNPWMDVTCSRTKTSGNKIFKFWQDIA